MFILVHYFHLIPISHHAPFHLNGCIDFVDASSQAKFEIEKRRASYQFVQARCSYQSRRQTQRPKGCCEGENRELDGRTEGFIE